MKQFIYIALISILLVAVPVAAKTSAKEAAEQSLAAVTIFMDVNKLTRKNIAAKNMTESHQDFAAVADPGAAFPVPGIAAGLGQHRERHVVVDSTDVSEVHLHTRVERQRDFPVGNVVEVITRRGPSVQLHAGDHAVLRCEIPRSALPYQRSIERSPIGATAGLELSRRAGAVVIADAVARELVEFAFVGR